LYVALFCGIVSFFNRFLYSLNIFLIACLWVVLEYYERIYKRFLGIYWLQPMNNLIVAQIAFIYRSLWGKFCNCLGNALAAKLISYYLELQHRLQGWRSLELFILL